MEIIEDLEILKFLFIEEDENGNKCYVIFKLKDVSGNIQVFYIFDEENGIFFEIVLLYFFYVKIIDDLWF